MNTAPAAQTFNINVTEDLGPQLITLGGDDGDPQFIQQLTYSIFTNPSHGTLSSFNATAGTVLYTPAPNYFGPDSFTYKVADDGATVLSLQGTVNGSLTSPGQSDQFTFTLGARTNVYFDALTNDPSLTWTLKGADITITEAFANSDWATNNAVRSLPAGSYTLTVDRDGDSVGPYQFRLIDLSTATPLQLPLGTPTNGTLNPTNETDFYKFSATAGQKFYLDSISLTGDATNAYWRLVDPYGNFVPGAGSYMGADIGEVTIPVSGTYTILAEGYPADGGVSGSYSFNVVPVNNPAPQTLTLGSTVNGNIPSPGQTDTYTFTLGTNARLYMDTLVNDSNVSWSLKGPAADAITGDLQNPDWWSANPVLDLPAGSYTLTMRRDNGATGTYKFRLLDLSANAESTALGATLTRTLSPENETDVYKFTTAAGNRFNIDYQSSSGAPSAYWRLIDPVGKVVAGTNVPISSDFGPITSTYGGTYTLLLEGAPFDSGASASYTFSIPQLSNVVIPPVTGTAYTLDTTIPLSTIGVVGEVDDYKFTVPAGPDVLVYLDTLTNDSNLRWTLVGPSGTFSDYLYSSDWYDSTPVMRLAAGTYKLSIDGNGSTGSYRFNLRTLGSATPLTLPLGTPVNGTLNPNLETDLYNFDGTAGAQYYFDAGAITGDIGNAYWQLIDPFGQPVSGATNNVNGGDFGPITLPSTGKYTVLVEGYPFESGVSGGYTINVIPVVNPAPQAVTFGTPINGNTTTPGQVDTYTFSLLSDTKVYLDTLSNESTVLWSLKGPVTTNFNYLYGTDWYSSDPVMTLPAGDYTLSMKRDGGTLGTYKFRLLDLASATPLTLPLGTPVNGTLNPNNETDLYNFDGTAGAQYYFDASSITGDIGSAYWRLIDPYGKPVPGATNNVNGGDFGPITLPVTGKYTVLVEGYPFEGGVSGGYTINVVPVLNPAPQALIFDGTTINGNIATPGQRDAYTFTLGAESKLYLDSLTGDGNVYWTLKGPAGATPLAALYASDWYNGNPVMTLPAGDYTLTITRYQDSTGPYKFRLLNMATNAESITPGTPLTRTLTPENETDIYTFSATAGNRFNFDSQSVTGAPNAYWRLVDPFGNVVPSTNVPLYNDFGPVTITYSGTYTLLVEGYVNEVGASASYTFNVAPLSNVVIPPVSGALMNLDTSLANSTISASGEIDNYKFVIPDGPDVLVYVDGQTDDGNMHWTITGPSGTFSNYFTNSDWNNSTPFMKLAAGTYKLAVDGSGATGSYKFKVRTIGSAVSLPVAGITSTLNPANETDLYYLDAVAGEQYYFDASATTGTIGNAAWRLIDPYGKPVPNASSYVNNGDFGPITIPTSGRYTVLVEGYPYEITSGGYTIKAWKVQNLSPAPLTSPAATANITVLNVNDAPVLDNTGDMTFPAINEDAFTNTGTTIAGLIASAGGDRITDADSDPEGIAVTAAPASGGNWQYTLDGGTNWLPVGTVSGSSALLLPDTPLSRIRFVPLTNFNGSRSFSSGRGIERPGPRERRWMSP
ncbi:MAG: Ig-like domain-containing protein [Planctomycetales bacterium]